MKIGLDVSVVQTPHRMRGIGATTINFVKHLPAEAKASNEFVLFLYPEEQAEALEILDLSDVTYKVRSLKKQERINLKFPGKLKKLNGPLNSLRSLLNKHKGDRRIKPEHLKDLDVYLQFDQMQLPPKRRGLKTNVILYDLIPYIMESDYMWGYRTARGYGDSRKSSLRKALLRHQYISEVKTVCKQASKLIAISQHTKEDFVRYAHVNARKIKVVHLGIGLAQSSKPKEKIEFKCYVENSWGYVKKPITMDDKPFILFVGGADPRRKIIDLVAAYNNLKAQGTDIRLVLAGDTMKGTKSIPIPTVQKYINNSAYLNDIVFLGFVTDEQREWLYENALTFVYPSVYEGFGLPILEAMQYGTPVITYKNSSIEEIAGDAAIFTNDHLTIMHAVQSLLNDPSTRKQYESKGRAQASGFSWDKTISEIFRILNV